MAALRVGLVAVVILAGISLAGFFGAGVLLGGFAMNGKVENGHCWLSDHGRYTQVACAVWRYSLWHGYSLFASNPLALAAALALQWLGPAQRAKDTHD